MLSKLSLRNVRKSYRDFSVYFITLTFSVALFYIFNSFDQQSTILDLRQGQGTMIKSMVMVMDVMSVIVAGVFAFLILYANNFLVKRRKKELGLYELLGMEKRDISLVLIYETVIIGICSLAVGLILGIIFSQLTSVFTARLLAVSVNYGFVFSLTAMIKTILIFFGVFVIVALFNQRTIRKQTLIDLLKSDRMNEETNVKGGWGSFAIFILGVVILIGAYLWALIPLQLIVMMLPIVIVGTIATFLIFKSFSGFLLQFMKSNKRSYYKNLNAFVFRQVTSKINSTYKVMAAISLMLLVGMGTLITGFNLNTLMAEQLNDQIAFDYTMSVFDEDIEPVNNMLDSVVDIERYASMPNYSSKDEKGFVIGDVTGLTDDHPQAYLPMRLVKVSDYNRFREMRGLEPVVLDKGQITVYSRMKSVVTSDMKEAKVDLPEELKSLGAPITLFGQDYEYVYSEGEDMRVENQGMAFKANLLVASDADVNAMNAQGNLEFMDTIFAVEGVSGHDSNTLNKGITTLLDEKGISYMGTGRQEVIDSSKGLELIFTYIALYLGIVFLLTSGVILALQQLSEANDNQKRYLILSKMGVDQKMMKGSVLKQNAIYFVVPLLVGLLHTFVGIKAVNVNLSMAGLANTNPIPTVVVMSFMLALYGMYFWIAYSGSKRILNI